MKSLERVERTAPLEMPRRMSVRLARTGALVALLLAPAAAETQSPFPPERESVYRELLDFASLIENASLEPHWMADGRSFWYVEGAPAQTAIWVIDGARPEPTPLLNADRLRDALTAVLGHEPPYRGIPFERFDFLDDETAIRFELEERAFRMALDTYEVTETSVENGGGPAAADAESESAVPELPSPTGDWSAVAEDHDIHLRAATDGRLMALTSGGEERYAWGLGDVDTEAAKVWSPDGGRLLVRRTDARQVHHMPVVHWLKTQQEEITWQAYAGSGEVISGHELHVFDVISGESVQIDVGESHDQELYPLGWRPDGSEVLFLRADRLYKVVELLAASPPSGESRVLMEETQDTFVEGLSFNPANLFYPFSDGSHYIWRSERDGWSHLYLYDRQGQLVRRLTAGDFPVDDVITIDEENRWVYYRARDDRSRPYDLHVWRVDLDGQRATRLTQATGVHTAELAPGKQYFLDTHSTIERPPSVELRSVDGALVRTVVQADISALQQLGWRAPEEFMVKADDGVTDLYGALYVPFDFDPVRRYPVVDVQYMGNFRQSAPRRFVGDARGDEAQALTQLGFVVFVVDARGTTGRGKAFQDFTYNSIGRIEVPDHAAALRQLAATRPYMDTTRVGITGYSWGGYFTIRALLTAPETFHVGFAGAPVVDFRAHRAPVEPYMGLPQDNPEGYEQASNLRLADRLEGKLLITIGTSDVNVTFNHSMRMADAFIKANKHFDLIVFPEEAHGLEPAARSYYVEARARYFVEHLKPYE